jgi:hypothetical protein
MPRDLNSINKGPVYSVEALVKLVEPTGIEPVTSTMPLSGKNLLLAMPLLSDGF